MTVTRLLLPLTAILLAIGACTAPGGTPSAARLDALTPTTGAAGTAVEITGRIPADATLHLCGVALDDLQLSDPETTAATHFTRANGTVPTLTPGSSCTLTVVLDGETVPHAGGTHTFTTDPTAPDDARLDTLAPTTGTTGTVVEITGQIPADATLHLCGVALDDLQLSDPETTAATHFTRANGTVPTLTPGSSCTLTVVLDGQTLPHAGATLTFTTDAGPPDAPTDLSATPGNASLTIAFTLPSDGGSPIALLEYTLDDGANWIDAAATTSPLQLGGLTNEQAVTLRLRVANAAGTGPASDPITATPTAWGFAIRGGGPNGDQAWGVSTLADGGAIVTGSYHTAASFGSTTLMSAENHEVFVARVDPDGSWAWATSAAGPSEGVGTSVSALPDGSAIVAGYFRATTSFGSTTLTSTGHRDVFVAKIDADGSWAWATSAGGSAEDLPFGVDTFADGGAIVTGYFRGSATFGATTITSAGADDMFVAKTNPDGSWAWAVGVGSTSIDRGFGVGTFGDGSAIVAGYFQGTVTFGTTALTAPGTSDGFVAKIDPDGNWVWATQAGGASIARANIAGTLADGSAIITSTFQGTVDIGETTLTSAGGTDVYVARIDPNGTWIWATRAGGPGNETATGSTRPDGSAIIAGTFADTATFGTTTLTSTGGPDVYVAMTNPDGSWAWAASGGGTELDHLWDVSTFNDGTAIIAGYFEGSATFGATTLTSTGGTEAFVAKVNASGAW